MSDLNFKHTTGQGLPGDRAGAVPALTAGAQLATSGRYGALGRIQRRRLNSQRLKLADSGFRLFRVY